MYSLETAVSEVLKLYVSLDIYSWLYHEYLLFENIKPLDYFTVLIIIEFDNC